MSRFNDKLKEALGDPYVTGDELLFFCPFCRHRKRKLSVNAVTQCWKCWVCNERGRSAFSLFWRLGKRDECNEFRAVRSLAQDQGADQDWRFSLPDEYVPLVTTRNVRAFSYLRRRGVNEREILRHKIGYADSGRFEGRVILPSFAANGRANFFAARAVRGQSLRYLNPTTPKGYKKSIVLNELNLDWKQPVVIVEGFFDMLKVSNATPLFGSKLADDCRLLQELVLRGSTVYVCLDPDARTKQLDIIAELNAYGVSAYDVKLSEYSDLAAASSDAIAQAFEQAHPLSRTQILKERISCSSRSSKASFGC